MKYKRPVPLILTAVAGLVLAGCVPDSAAQGGPKTAMVQKPKPNNDPLSKVLAKVGAKARRKQAAEEFKARYAK